ncbi:hypothetical protein F2Q70_00000174 [Brassica cretica]|uniref:EF-hand domain-containing protein n=1 Tax=Brassica cretica TaxID=69181 RepID=A0A8S9J1Z3_BRACR|nr:hypothetical protein F2Q70_00000174 [Brassica cretica]
MAEDGIGLPEQILDQSSFGESAKYYFIYTRLDLIWSLNYFALILINFFEQPLWCENKPTPSCKDRDYYYLGELPYLTNAESIIFEARSRIFWTSRLNLVKMFILFTTSNNPDVWIRAYKSSRWSSLFFVLYVLIGVYFVTNLILAVVYDSFKEQLAKQVSGMDQMKRRMLEKAFGLIDKDKTGQIDKEQCIKLFEQLTNYRTLPKISKEEFGLIFDELDDTRDFKINKDEFADLCQAIALRFQKEEVPSLFENFPQIYHSALSQQLRAFVRSPRFGYAISFILVLNFIAVVVETTLDIEESSAQKPWQVAEFVFGWIYVLEMALKIYSYGFENYWRDGQNRFDFIVTWVIVIGETATFITPDENTFFSNGEW